MEKINQVIDMIEHPDQYTEAQVENILQDEECRQTYLTMMEMRMAFDKEDEELKQQDVDQEWQKLVNVQKPVRLHFTWSKIAASLVGVLLLSGITVAAIHTYSSSHHEAQQDIADTAVVAKTNSKNMTQLKQAQPEESTKQKEILHKTFDNVTLGVMLEDMAKYYGVGVEYRNAEAKHLRFYYEWSSEDELKKVVDELNHSQQMSLSLEDDKIIVE